MNPNSHHLRNQINRELAAKLVQEESFARKTVSFYRYVEIEDPKAMRDQLFVEWSELKVFGRIYVAKEGINAQLNVPEPNWDKFVEKLSTHPEFADMPFKIALEEKAPSFIKLTIKVKQQIVADGLTPDDYDISNVGTHLEPEDFHAALEDDDVVVVDMRNQYESEIGHFEGAVCPDVDTFKEQLPMVKEMLEKKKPKKVLLYCTGGIRCEKASAYLKHNGIDNVYQLKGGIIRYAEEMEKRGVESKFKGKNFVFDERRAERVTDDVLSSCHQCEHPSDEHTNCKNEMCNLLFIQCGACATQWDGCCSEDCKKIAQLPDEERRELRKNWQRSSTFKRYRRSLRPKECLT